MVRVYGMITDTSSYDKQHALVYELLYRVAVTVYGYDRAHLQIDKTEQGKPYFVNCPLQFSMCHTDGLVLAAFSEDPVGVDAEKNDRTVSSRVSRRFLGKETANLKDWTEYEAVSKMIGCGIPLTDYALDQIEYHARFYTDFSDYTICCVAKSAVFAERIILI